MTAALSDTLRMLEDARQQHDACLVAFSGGKDSWVVLDLAAKTFPRVEAFFMYLVPGLDHIETELQRARDRYNLVIHQYPHWVVPRLIYHAVYTDLGEDLADVGPDDWTLQNVYDAARADTGIPLLATGAKKADSLWRRRVMAVNQWDCFYPVREWTKADVFAYLKNQKIPLPPSSGRAATVVDLSTPSILWLHDTYPADYEKLRAHFPYVQAVVERRRFYGDVRV